MSHRGFLGLMEATLWGVGDTQYKINQVNKQYGVKLWRG